MINYRYGTPVPPEVGIRTCVVVEGQKNMTIRRDPLSLSLGSKGSFTPRQEKMSKFNRHWPRCRIWKTGDPASPKQTDRASFLL